MTDPLHVESERVPMEQVQQLVEKAVTDTLTRLLGGRMEADEEDPAAEAARTLAAERRVEAAQEREAAAALEYERHRLTVQRDYFTELAQQHRDAADQLEADPEVSAAAVAGRRGMAEEDQALADDRARQLAELDE